MQKELLIWRRSNPMVFLCGYLLMGVFCFRATNHFGFNLSKLQGLSFLLLSSFILCIYTRFKKPDKALQLLPTMILILWGYCIALYNQELWYFDGLMKAQWIIDSRQFLYNKLDHFLIDKASNEFAKTLLFGSKSNMTIELKKAYQTLGILHIVAISGMHLDILFNLLEHCSSLLPKIKWVSYVKLFLLLFIVWTYTCIAHAGPSVIRASLFFSIILLGRFFYWNFFSLNIISTGILLVLLYNISILSSIGLQLSYAAVIGIHCFYRVIIEWAPMENRILNFIWNNLAISIAAQLTTLPLILFYFQTSSSLSIIGNFLFVPISSLLLYCLLLFLLLPNYGGLPYYFAKGITGYINTMNEAIMSLFNLLQVGEQKYQLGMAGLVYYYFMLFIGFYWIQCKAPNAVILLLGGTCIYSLQKLFSF